MNVRQRTVETLPRIGTFLAAVLVGAGLATLVPPDPVTLPAVGSVPGPAVGATGLVAGGALYTLIPASSNCGCGGDCNC